LVHRDLKPGNIMLTCGDSAQLEVKVIDFGLAKATADAAGDMDLTHGGFVGTPTFASPEQFKSGPIDARSDIYSLGVTLWYALTGLVPHRGRTIDEIRDCQTRAALPIAQLVARKIPAPVIKLLRSTLAVDPAQRPASPRELMEVLEFCRAKLAGGGGIRSFRKLAVVIAVVVIAAAALFALRLNRQKRISTPANNTASSASTLTPLSEKSIAVLPFENLSAGKDNSYFARGVQDEILSHLAKIADLKVISRTSVLQYQGGAPRNLREIGNALGVAHVLEGSVQRVANRVRVNAQLIDTRTDAHLWAETYDRDLANVFAVQTEIAQKIADQLQAKISPREKAAIEERPTKDLVAYDLYVQAKSVIDKAAYEHGKEQGKNYFQAIELLNQAIARDSAFLLAYCRLAEAHDELYLQKLDHTPSRLELAKSAINSAFRLKPDSGQAHLALATHLYHGYLDYDHARDELDIASRTLPNNAQIFEWSGYIDRRQNRWHDAVRDFNHAMELDPRNVKILTSAEATYSFMREYKKEREVCDRLIALESNNIGHRLRRAWIDFFERADTRAMHAAVEKKLIDDYKLTRARFYLALYERDAVAADHALGVLSEDTFEARGAKGIGMTQFSRAYANGLVAWMKGDAAGAQLAFSTARTQQEEVVREQPGDGPVLCVLGLIDAGLGRKEDALREVRRALELAPRAKDSLDNADVLYFYAVICAWTGERDLAIEQLETLAKIPAGVTYGELRLDPHWDPLRRDPRFEKIVASLAPSASALTPFPEKSIAVLPLENLSDEKENAFLAAGIQDELLSNLAKIKDVKVISRTSVMQYRSGITRNLKEIAQQLGVSKLVEGSVRRAGNRVRVSVQLIDAQTDRHIWVQNYDRTLTDSLALQSDLAKEIAAALGATLSPQEKALVAARPTNNSAAYDAYLRGRAFAGGSQLDRPNVEGLIRSYQDAVKLDPSFALAWAYLSWAQSNIYWQFDSDPARLAAAKDSLDRALALDPNLPGDSPCAWLLSLLRAARFHRVTGGIPKSRAGSPE
jgi:TolB-like protein/Flp pilus assembly protein TadD